MTVTDGGWRDFVRLLTAFPGRIQAFDFQTGKAMGETEVFWGSAESIEQLFTQSVREQEPAGAPEIVLEIGPLLPIMLIGDKVDETCLDTLQIFF